MGIKSEILLKILFLNNKMHFVFNEKSMQNLLNDAFGGAEPPFRFTGNCSNPGFGQFSSTYSGNNRFGTGIWTHKINLDRLPTKPEDLHVKMENESKTLSVSGKSRPHVWLAKWRKIGLFSPPNSKSKKFQSPEK